MKLPHEFPKHFVLLLSLAASVAGTTIQNRAFPNAPNGYAPQGGDCPSTRPSIRSAAKLSPNETQWLEKRRNNTIQPMIDLLSRSNYGNFNPTDYINNHRNNASALPNIAIAASGGGYRAKLNGGGNVKAFDSRSAGSGASGGVSGLLQAATYFAGLSGAGWLVGSIYVNNFTTVTELQSSNSGDVWQDQNSIFTGPSKGSISLRGTANYYDTIIDDVNDKKNAGFNTSITDYWGRALSYQLINATDGGPAYTWSSIQQQDSFANGESPLPILVSDGRAPGTMLVSLNSTVFEFTPWELGTWDPTTFGFAPLEFIGSKFSNGSLPSDQQCVRGFDNAGFVMGTSSSLFNSFLLNVNDSTIPSVAKNFISKLLASVSSDDNDIADYTPNPFYGYNPTTSDSANSTRLTLVDGGTDLQNIPLHPLIQPVREVDVIFAVDSSADTNGWPNGTSMVATYERSMSDIANGTAFPAVPDVNSFVNLGLNNRPTFFGCNSSNTSSVTPLVVYLPNAPYVYHSNVSTFQPSYSIGQRNAIVQNGYNSATQGNGSLDQNWPACVGCAILSRSLERTGTPVPDVCTQCFSRYCWDGKTNSTQPNSYQPAYKLSGSVLSAAGRGSEVSWSLGLAAGAMMMGLFF